MVSGNVVNLVLVDNNNQSITIPSIERIRKNKFEKIKVKLIDYLKPTRLECLIQDIQLMQREDDLISIFLEFAGCLK